MTGCWDIAHDVADVPAVICGEGNFVLEKFVEVGSRFADAALQARREAAIVDHRQVAYVPTFSKQFLGQSVGSARKTGGHDVGRLRLDLLAEANATGVRADLDVVLGRHEQHREDLRWASNPARVNLAEFDRWEFAFLQARQLLQQLLEDDLVLRHLARGHANAERLERFANHPLHAILNRAAKHGRCTPTPRAQLLYARLPAAGGRQHGWRQLGDRRRAYVANHVIAIRGLFDPHRLELCKLRHIFDRLLHKCQRAGQPWAQETVSRRRQYANFCTHTLTSHF